MPFLFTFQWTPKAVYDVFVMQPNARQVSWVKQALPVEVYICHNGDLDFFEVSSVSRSSIPPIVTIPLGPIHQRLTDDTHPHFRSPIHSRRYNRGSLAPLTRLEPSRHRRKQCARMRVGDHVQSRRLARAHRGETESSSGKGARPCAGRGERGCEVRRGRGASH